jgi:type I restriction enzyme M protein
MSEADVDAIVGAFRSGTPGEEVPARLVEHSQIKENGFDLNIGRYLKTVATEAIDVPSALMALREAQTKLREAEMRLDERLKAAGYE